MVNDFLLKIGKMLVDGLRVLSIKDNDCNKAIDSGIYDGTNSINSPALGKIKLVVTKYTDTWIVQEVLTEEMRVYLRSYNFGRWSNWQEIEYISNGDCEEEHIRLDKRISKLALDLQECYNELKLELDILKNKTITGNDIIINVDNQEMTLQSAINHGLFCKCDHSKAICGTFKVTTMVCGKQ